MDSVRIVKEYYDQSAQAEWERIAGRPEFLLTCRHIDRYVKPGDRVLDIGGGPGRYSLYLAEKGVDVTLLDLSDGNVAFARAKAEELGLSLEALQGDAREADVLVTGLFDHVLLMGPLYHLLEEDDRARAVQAALNLLKPGGTLFVSFISMSGGLIYAMKIDPAALASPEPDDKAFYSALAEARSYAGPAFTHAFLIQQREVLPFMARFPIKKLHFFGQEGVTSPCEGNIMTQSPHVVAAWLDLSERLCEREELLSWAEHLMYVGQKP